jgi:O-antigen ligase
LLGLGEFAWPLAAGVMIVYLVADRSVRVPRGFGVWLVFLLWTVASMSQVDTLGRMVGAGYRVTMYISAIVLFVYVYNAGRTLTDRRLLGLLTVFFAWIVVGGYLGLAFPTATLRTPLASLLPEGLLSNELVQQMAVRRLTQYNPDAWNVIDPRPSAPFLYANNWGNAYSLLVPAAVLYARRVRGTARFVWVGLLLIASVVPAFLTLNRGMFLGLGLIGLLVALRFAGMGHGRALLGLLAMAVGALVALQALPVMDRLENRLATSGTNESRTAVYSETVRETATSPLLGYGAPRPATNVSIDVPPLGTQGQFWMVVFSHGFVGAFLFACGFAWLVAVTIRRRDVEGVVFNAVLVATAVESLYYGLLGVGLGVSFVVAAMATRPKAPVAVPTGGET